MELKIGRKYKNSQGVEGTLTVTQREGANYRWIPCLALIDSQGNWVVSTHWRTNHVRKAHNDLINLGCELVGDL